MTVLEFKRPEPPTNDPRVLYEVTIYENATHFFDPNRDEPDRRAAADALFDSTFHVHVDQDDCQLLVMIGAERSDSIRMPGAFETPAQRQWLARRLDSIYEQVTGERRSRGILERLTAFFRSIFTQGDPK